MPSLGLAWAGKFCSCSSCVYTGNQRPKKKKAKINIFSRTTLPEWSWVHWGGDTAPPPAPPLLSSFPYVLPLEPKTGPAPESLWTERPTLSGSWPSASPTLASSSPSFPQLHWTGSQHTAHGLAGQRSSSEASCVWHNPGAAWGGGTSLEVAGSAGFLHGEVVGSWSAWRWSAGQWDPTQRKHYCCYGKPAWSCWGCSPRPGCRARGWYQTSMRVGGGVHALLSRGKNSSHFAVEQERKKNKDTRIFTLDQSNFQ